MAMTCNEDILDSVYYVVFSVLGTLHDQLALVHTGFIEALQITINIGNHHHFDKILMIFTYLSYHYVSTIVSQN